MPKKISPTTKITNKKLNLKKKNKKKKNNNNNIIPKTNNLAL